MIKWKLSGKQDVYIEVAKYFEEHILKGVFKSGEKLPSVRFAAGELGVNPNTVAKAYASLEEKGYIKALPKKGAFVIYSSPAADEKVAALDKENDGAVPDMAAVISRNTVMALKDSGIKKDMLLKLIEEVYEND